MHATRFSRRTGSALLFIGAVVASGCGGDKVASAPGGGGNDDDAGGGRRDAGADAGEPESDAGEGDAAIAPAPVCTLVPEELTLPIDDRGSHTWDATKVGDTIHVAYEVPTCTSMPVKQAQRLDHLSFSSTGAFGEAAKIVNHVDGTQCFFTRTPTLSADKSGNVALYYSGTNTGSAELYQKQVGDDSGALRITMDSDKVRDVEEHMAVAPFGPSDLVAYVNATPVNQGPSVGQVVTRRPGSLEEAVIVAADLGWHISGLALGAFAADNALGGVLAYIADVAETPTISAQLLDKAGKASGAPVKLTDKLGPFSNVNIAMLEPGSDDTLAGAVVYGVGPDDLRTELRFRTIGQDGSFGPEQKLTSGNRNTSGVGIAPFADGYVVAFRLIDGADTSILLKFINKSGATAALGERTLVAAETSGSPPEVFVTTDGRISVVFANKSGDGMFLRAVRAVCDP